jgi:hypothetical protein
MHLGRTSWQWEGVVENILYLMVDRKEREARD